jgi:hypothetical protein
VAARLPLLVVLVARAVVGAGRAWLAGRAAVRRVKAMMRARLKLLRLPMCVRKSRRRRSIG